MCYLLPMQRVLFLIGLLIAAPVGASEVIPVAKFDGWQGPKPAKPPCLCRAPGGHKVNLGAKTCVKRGGSLVTMQCRLVLNNTIWKQIEDGCDVAVS